MFPEKLYIMRNEKPKRLENGEYDEYCIDGT